MAKPSVSVIIPTYNRAEFIGSAIESVLKQKGQWNLEVIVVDDGSTDDTREILKKFGDKIRYFKNPHFGRPAVPRNFGLGKARGELIAFQDSDDLWTPNKLAAQAPLFDDPKVVMSYGQASVINEAGQDQKKALVPAAKLARGQKFISLLQENVISTLTVMARKSAIEAAGGFNESKGLKAVEDYDLWLRIAAQNPSGIKALNKTLAIHRAHSGNISAADDQLALERIITVFDSLWQFKLEDGQRAALEKQTEEMHRSWGRLQDEAGNHPLISVVMGIYKDESYVGLAVKSILDQTFRNFEFIIINDGSPDRSAQIVKDLGDRRIRLVNQTNRGLVDSLNKGIGLARGQFIARQDADDISLPTRFEKELSLLSSRPQVGLVGAFFAYIDEKNNQTGTVITAPTKHLDLRRSFYITNPFPHGCSLYRKEAYEDAGGYRDDYGPTEDYDLWRRMADLDWEIAIIPEVLYLYRLLPTGISHQKGEIQAKFTAKIIAEQFKKPFVLKGYQTIVRDARYYRKMDNPFAAQVFNQYVNEQFVIAMEMLARGWAKSGTITALAAWRLDRKLGRRLVRPIIGGWLRKFNLKPRKQ